MAEALVSLVVEELGSIMVREIEQEVRLVVGVKGQIGKLKSNLTTIQALLADAETRQVREATVRDWLEKLKDLAYDIEDVLDDLEAAILSSQSKPADEQDRKPERKVFFFLRSSCFCCKQVGRRHNIANKIEELNERFDLLAQEKERYKVVPTEANPTIDVTMVKGKDQDTNMLLSEPSVDDRPDIPVISTVGMGGIGNTTLAQFAFNHIGSETYLDETNWD